MTTSDSAASPATVRVYVNGTGVDAPASGTALDAVRVWNADAAAEVERGTRALTDSRGLPAAPDSPVHGGAIFRLVNARQRAAED